MELVIDANILFAAVIKEGKTRELITSKGLRLFAPDHLLVELEKYEKLLQTKSILESEVREVTRRILTNIKIVRPEQSLIETADSFSPDLNDSPYFALCLEMDCMLWSNDKRLKEQSKIKVYSTDELNEILNS